MAATESIGDWFTIRAPSDDGSLGGTQTLGCFGGAGYCPNGTQNAPGIVYSISTEIQHGDNNATHCATCDIFHLYGQVVAFDFDLLAGQVYDVTFESPYSPFVSFGSVLAE